MTPRSTGHASRRMDENQPLFEQIEPPNARALVAAGVDCFAEQGFYATTTRDIAARAKLSPAAVYVHFPSKADLLYTISRVGHGTALRVLEEAPGEESDPTVRLRLIVSRFAAWHARNNRLARVVQYELDALPKGKRAEIVAIRQRFRTFIQGEIEAGVAAGDLTALDPGGAALAILSVCIDVARWYSPRGERTPEDIEALYGDLMLRMLGAVS